jgi:hypothetical protein
VFPTCKLSGLSVNERRITSESHLNFCLNPLILHLLLLQLLVLFCNWRLAIIRHLNNKLIWLNYTLLLLKYSFIHYEYMHMFFSFHLKAGAIVVIELFYCLNDASFLVSCFVFFMFMCLFVCFLLCSCLFYNWHLGSWVRSWVHTKMEDVRVTGLREYWTQKLASPKSECHSITNKYPEVSSVVLRVYQMLRDIEKLAGCTPIKVKEIS